MLHSAAASRVASANVRCKQVAKPWLNLQCFRYALGLLYKKKAVSSFTQSKDYHRGPNMENGDHQVQEKTQLEPHTMSSGDGPTSYAKNSCYQRGVIDAARAVIVQAIRENLDTENLSFESPRPFRIADFGCSTGPNTFVAMQNVIEAVELKYKSMQKSSLIPEFQVFFNDLVDNDFNTLFRTLPWPRKYFAAGVPGSFYGPIFPKATLNFVHSSYALHWLSKVPKEVVEKNSPSWNKNKVYCAGTKKETTEAYFAQFKKDLNSFLNARAAELVENGLAVIHLAGLPNGVLPAKTGAGMLLELLGSCLLDLANMGSVSKDKVDTFSLPLYLASIGELETVIEMNRHFTIEKIEILDHPMKHLPFDAKMTCFQTRAIMEGFIKDHFGSGSLELVFGLYSKKLAEKSFIFDQEIRKDADLSVLLKLKSRW